MPRSELLSRSYRNAVVNTLGLVGYWRLGEAAGTVAKDETGRNAGTFSNTPTLAASGALSGDPNTGVGFVRASTQQMATAAVVSTLVNDFTAMCWFYKTVSFQNYECIFYNGLATGGVRDGWGLYSTVDGKLWGLSQGVGDLTDNTSGSIMSTLQWYQATLLRRSGTSYTYLNGTLNQTGGTNVPVAPSTLTTVASDGASSNNFNGTIDEFAIFNRALPDADIAHFYSIGRGF